MSMKTILDRLGLEKICLKKKVGSAYFGVFQYSNQICKQRAERYLSNRDSNGVCHNSCYEVAKKTSKKNLGIGWPASLEKAGK